jgi:hypothetical protein
MVIIGGVFGSYFSTQLLISSKTARRRMTTLDTYRSTRMALDRWYCGIVRMCWTLCIYFDSIMIFGIGSRVIGNGCEELSPTCSTWFGNYN